MHVPISSEATRRSARRRVAALAYGVAPAGPYLETIETPQAARTREPLHAVALIVFAAHAAIMVALWHAFVPDLRPMLPRALDVEVDASASARVAAPGVPRRAEVAPSVPPAHAYASRDAVAHRENPANLPAPRQVDHAKPARSPVTTAAAAVDRPDNVGPRALPAPAPPAAAHASAESAVAPVRTAPAAPPAAESAPITAPRFAAAYLHNPAPDYPDVAQRRGWEGTTFLNVHVLASGLPDQVLLSASSGHDALDDAAVAAVRDWRFVPAKRGAESIDGWVRVPVVFKLGN
ncbi:energy transducer TonB [Burkholderia sp. A9]|uniref:energy transducer TonB n=1 Tax=Burkholderia sp. A9 TaxID=1365108 RepID=UPI001F43E7AB|nr:energy transducer TonB [Burkholderia sp. A9]